MIKQQRDMMKLQLSVLDRDDPIIEIPESPPKQEVVVPPEEESYDMRRARNQFGNLEGEVFDYNIEMKKNVDKRIMAEKLMVKKEKMIKKGL